MSNTSPWIGEPLTIAKCENGTMLTVRTARAGDDPQFVFKTKADKDGPAQLEDLFATLVASKYPIRAANIVFFGKEKYDNGNAKAIRAAATVEYEDKKTGETKEANFAYSHEQADALVPVSFFVKSKWANVKGRKVLMPLLQVFELPFERTATQAAMGFQRVTQREVLGAPPIVRAVAKSRA